MADNKNRTGGLLSGLFKGKEAADASGAVEMTILDGMPTPVQFRSQILEVMEKARRNGLLLDVQTPWGRIYVDGRDLGENGEVLDTPQWMNS